MDIKTVGVVGCGLMGSGIAEVCARAGYEVWVREVNEQFLETGDWKPHINRVLARLVEAADVSRAYIFQNHTGPEGELLMSLRHEWFGAGVPSRLEHPGLQALPYVAGGFFCGFALGLLLLWSGMVGSIVLLAVVLVGLGLGAELDVMPYVVGRYFGLRAFGEIYSYTFAVFTRWFGQKTCSLEAERKGGLDSTEYRAKRERIRLLAGAQAIDRALAAHRLDALVAITCGPAWVTDLVYGDNWNVPCSYSPAAVAGYPGASVPGGFLHGLPVGISFYAGAWQDASVLAIAHAFDLAHGARRPPAYLPTVADARGDAPPF